MAFDILHHHDGIIDNKPDRENDRQRVRRLMVNPASIIKNTAPMSEIGMATTGMITVRSDPMKRKITIMTISNVSLSVFKTSLIALSM